MFHMKGLLWTKEVMVFYCFDVCFLYWSLACLQQIQMLFVKVKNCHWKTAAMYLKIMFFSLKHLKKCVFNPKDAYWKGLKFMHQHHVQLSPLWWLQCKEKKLHTLRIWFQALPDIWHLYTANWSFIQILIIISN